MRDPDDREQFTHLLQGLCAVYQVEPTVALMTGYWLGLQDLPIGDVSHAVARALKHGGKYMPKPAELREMSGETTPELRAAVAWDVVRRSISTIGAYQSVQFTDPLAGQAVAAMGGWARLASIDTSEVKWAQKEFERLYVAMAKGGLEPMASPVLRGIHAANAARDQYAEPEPMRVRIDHGRQKALPAPARKAVEGK